MPPLDLSALFDAEQERLLALAARLTGDHAAAEDALQETFLLAHRHEGSFRGEARPETWLYRIAIRAATRRRRRDRAARTRDQLHAAPPGEARPHAEIDALRQAMSRLPAEARLLLTLLSLRGLPARVVAEVLGIPEGTVYSRAHAARRALRSLMQTRPGP